MIPSLAFPSGPSLVPCLQRFIKSSVVPLFLTNDRVKPVYQEAEFSFAKAILLMAGSPDYY